MKEANKHVKELDEAEQLMADILNATPKALPPGVAITQILNLRGKNWKIAILGKPFEIDPSGLVDGKGIPFDRITIPNVIWEGK